MRRYERSSSMHDAVSSDPTPFEGIKRAQRLNVGTARHAEPQKATRLIWPVVALLCWTVSSSGLILLNKELMVGHGFRYPMALTAAGQFTSYLGGLALAKAGFMTCRARPDTEFLLKRLLPIVLLSALSLITGNMAYFTLSVAFIQVIKVMLPAITLSVGVAAGIEHLTLQLTAAVLLISAGTGSAAFLESQTSHFSFVGLAYFFVSAVSEACRTILMQLLLGNMRYNAVEALVYLSPATGVCLALCSALFEWDGLIAPHGGFSIALSNPVRFALAAAGGFVVNLTSYWAIKATSGLTFKVLGCVKNAFVVFAGVLMGDVISGKQLVGYAVSVAGFALYTLAKSPVQPAAGKKKV